jgi:CBS domain-containing protein
VALAGKSSKGTRVREIISTDVISVTPDSTVEECMRLMTEHRVRHLPVCQGDRMVGFISIGDLVNWTISMQSAVLDQMESYLAGR